MSSKTSKETPPCVKDSHSSRNNPIRTARTGTQSHSKDHDPLVKSGKSGKGR